MVHPCDAARERARTRLGSHSVYAQPVTVALALALADARSDRVAHAEVRAARAPHSIVRTVGPFGPITRGVDGRSRPHRSLLACTLGAHRRIGTAGLYRDGSAVHDSAVGANVGARCLRMQPYTIADGGSHAGADLTAHAGTNVDVRAISNIAHLNGPTHACE